MTCNTGFSATSIRYWLCTRECDVCAHVAFTAEHITIWCRDCPAQMGHTDIVHCIDSRGLPRQFVYWHAATCPLWSCLMLGLVKHRPLLFLEKTQGRNPGNTWILLYLYRPLIRHHSTRNSGADHAFHNQDEGIDAARDLRYSGSVVYRTQKLQRSGLGWFW